MTSFLWTITGQYMLFAFLACLGALQLAAVRAGRRRLWLLPHRLPTAALGACLLAAAYLYFFTQARFGARGLEGAQLFAYFGLGAVCAVLASSGAHALWAGHLGTARRRLLARARAAAAELQPLFARARAYRVKDEAR